MMFDFEKSCKRLRILLNGESHLYWLVCWFVCMFVCGFVWHLHFHRFLYNNYITTNSTFTIYYRVTYYWKTLPSMKKIKGQGQRSRPHWPLSQNHKNQFFSKSKDIVFFKLGEKLVLGGVQNRLDFGKNRSRH